MLKVVARERGRFGGNMHLVLCRQHSKKELNTMNPELPIARSQTLSIHNPSWITGTIVRLDRYITSRWPGSQCL